MVGENDKMVSVKNAERIKNVFPDGEILLTIRSQIQLIESYYSVAGCVLKNLPKPFDRRYIALLPWLEWAWENWENSFLGLIDYHKHIEMYQEIFGVEKVHVLLYEDFLNTPDEYIKKLSDILGIDYDEAILCISNNRSNPPDSTRDVNYLKFREYFFPNLDRNKIPIANNLFKLIDKYIESGSTPAKNQRLPDEWVNRLNDRYRYGNNILVDDYNLPLKKYSYPL